MLFGCFFNSHFVFVSGKHISFLNACAFGFAVIIGNLKKVYGNKVSGGIFDGCDPQHYIDLVLSNDQKVMRGKEIEDGRYCWTPDMENYNNSMYHKSPKFLDYDFKSIKCGYQTYP